MKKTILIPLLLLAFGGCTHNTSATMERPFEQIFPQGEKLPEQFSQYFIGQAYLARLTADTTLNCPIANVTFEPGCRNNWHSHTGGQILVATAGRGYYQEQGKPARELHPGDVVEIPADVIHWHGAAPDSCSPIWRSKPTRRPTATRGSARWTTNNTPKRRPPETDSTEIERSSVVGVNAGC